MFLLHRGRSGNGKVHPHGERGNNQRGHGGNKGISNAVKGRAHTTKEVSQHDNRTYYYFFPNNTKAEAYYAIINVRFALSLHLVYDVLDSPLYISTLVGYPMVVTYVY